MNILVLHHAAFAKMRYDQAIDHRLHRVIYAGAANYLEGIPDSVPHERIPLDLSRPIVEQLLEQPLPRLDRVVGRHETHILPAAVLRERFSTPGMRPDTAILFRDKVAMKARLASAGFRTPRVTTGSADAVAPDWTGPTVVKPKDGFASIGVRLYPSPEAALAAIRSDEAAIPAETLELEEYVEGPIWHVDGYVYRGEAIVAQAHKYVGTCLDYARGEPMGSVQYDRPDLEEWAVACIRALGGADTTFHLELIATPDGPVFLEAAARAAGGYKIRMFELRHRVHLHTLDVATQVELSLASRFCPEPRGPDIYGDFLFPGHVGCRSLEPEVAVAIGRRPDLETLMCDVTRRPTQIPTYRPENLPLSGVVRGRGSDEVERAIRSIVSAGA
jgi:hypothetical protein